MAYKEGINIPRAEAPTATVLVVDDDARLRHFLEVILAGDGFGVECVDDGGFLLEAVRGFRPDAVLLDIKMARVSGLTALRELRSAGEDIPVVMLSAADDEKQQLAAYDAGADDYVIKPFLPRVLLARLRAVLRRARLAERRNGDAPGGIALDPNTHDAIVNGQRVRLSPTEFALLRTLMRGHGRAFTANELLAAVWGEAYVGQHEIVRANIYRLRQKLEPRPAEPRFIHGQRGRGYRFAPGTSTRLT